MKLAPAALIAALGATAALAGCNNYPPPAPMGAPPPAFMADRASGQRLVSCFQARDIRGHRIVDNRTMYMNVNDRDVYRVTMSGACLAGSFSTDPIITRQPPGSSIICRPIDLDISIAHPGTGHSVPCIVDGIELMTPEQVAAIPSKLRP